ncbi:Protein MON2-like protein [Bienertia sinuspersici]
MAFMAVLESDLRALSAEARRRYPAVKDGAEHAIIKLRSLSSPSEIAHNDDILRIFLMACEVRTVKLSVIGLSCLQKLISHDAVAPSALKEILFTLKEHAEMTDETVQLKTLQTILIIFQSHMHPEDEESMAQALGICLRLLESSRSSDSVQNTAAATFRQAVALVFDHVALAESLPSGKFSSGGQIFRSSSVTGDVSRSIHRLDEYDTVAGVTSITRESITKAGAVGLRLLEDLTALAAGGSATWLHISSVQRSFALDILEFVLSNYVAVFRTLVPYEQVLRHKICSLLMTSLRTNAEIEGEAGEAFFRRLLLRSVSHIIRLYSSSLITESEVFLSMLVRVTTLDLPLWHHILVLEILRGFCVEVRTMRVLFQNFDINIGDERQKQQSEKGEDENRQVLFQATGEPLNPNNTNVVENIVKALARVVSSLQVQDTSEESLAAVAGMFSSKAKGIEWILDNDASNTAVLVASEAHAITLAIEGLLGVVFTIATLTDEAVDTGEVYVLWFLSAFRLEILSMVTAIVLEILKGYQAFTQACGVLQAVEPLNSFLASLCKFTINITSEIEKKSFLQSPGSKRTEILADQRDVIILTPKNVQVLETLAALDRTIHSPHATTQEVSTVSRLSRESSGHYSDFNILSSLNSQLFESSALMHISAVKSLVSALCQLSQQSLPGTASGFPASSSQKIGSISFSVERMISILVNNVHRVEPLWDPIVSHFLELAENSNQHLRSMALDALDRSISAVLGADQFQDRVASGSLSESHHIKNASVDLKSLERAVISPLRVLYFSTQSFDVRTRSLRILLHVLERHGEKLHDSWQDILEMLRSVACAAEKDLITLGFQSLRVIMNDGLSSIPVDCLQVCIDVTGAYSAQQTELNISLTAIGLLWTTTDFIAKGHIRLGSEENEKADGEKTEEETVNANKLSNQASNFNVVERDKLLISIFSLLQTLGSDERPESFAPDIADWASVFSQVLFTDSAVPAATSSRDEWHGKELGTQGGKAVHMLIHHSRNTAQKQWDETLVVVLGGIARLLRSFFPYISTLSNFWSGWQTLIVIVKSSIVNGSKEVALAAINCLQTTVLSHSVKGNFPAAYLKSVLDVYEHFLLESRSRSDRELFAQAQHMFDIDMYKQLLEVAHVAIQATMTVDVTAADAGVVLAPMCVTVVVGDEKKRGEERNAWIGGVGGQQKGGGGVNNGTRRTGAERREKEKRTCINGVLDAAEGQICPEKFEACASPCASAVPGAEESFFPSSDPSTPSRSILHYLPKARPSSKHSEDAKQAWNTDSTQEAEKFGKKEIPNGVMSTSLKITEDSVESGITATSLSGIQYSIFSERLIPLLIDLFLRAPDSEKYILYPEVIQALGRCMTTRRDSPDGSVWRLAVEGFIRILVSDVGRLSQKIESSPSTSRSARSRIWKEAADVFELFLVGYCGRALPSNVMSNVALEADISLDMSFLTILGDTILKSPIDAPPDVISFLLLQISIIILLNMVKIFCLKGDVMSNFLTGANS